MPPYPSPAPFYIAHRSWDATSQKCKSVKYLVVGLGLKPLAELLSNLICYDGAMSDPRLNPNLPKVYPSIYVDHLNALYPYHIWFDGDLHILARGTDFDCHRSSLRKHLYQAAKERGHRVRTRLFVDGIVVQAVDERGKPLTP